jgi:hypothetical protein
MTFENRGVNDDGEADDPIGTPDRQFPQAPTHLALINTPHSAATGFAFDTGSQPALTSPDFIVVTPTRARAASLLAAR